MAISKTGIQVDENSSFTRPLVYEENGQVNSVVADSLTPDTRYYTRAYVINDGTTVYSQNTKSFKTLEDSHIHEFLTLENTSRYENTISLVKITGYGGYNPPNVTVQYSTDNGTTWGTWDFTNVDTNSVTLPVNGKIMFKGNNTTYSGNGINQGNYMFRATRDTNVYGNIMSLVDPTLTSTTIPSNYCFNGLFYNMWYMKNTGIVLPATTLKEGCYLNLFAQTGELGRAPKLPATVMAPHCYDNMFMGSGITNPPTLPAWTLAERCYEGMFWYSSLENAPELPATTLAEGCYSGMFGYTNITEAPELNATTMAPYCYDMMFTNTGNLTTPPELPATTLAEGCYSSMFMGSSITTAPALRATRLATDCYKMMFQQSGISEIELPATNMASGCYNKMFYRASSMKKVICYSPYLTSTYTSDWLTDTSYRGDFYNLGNASTSYAGIPSGWTIHNSL